MVEEEWAFPSFEELDPQSYSAKSEVKEECYFPLLFLIWRHLRPPYLDVLVSHRSQKFVTETMANFDIQEKEEGGLTL